MNKYYHFVYIMIIIIIMVTVNKPSVRGDITIIPPTEGSFRIDTLTSEESKGSREVVYRDRIIEIPAEVDEDLLRKYEKAEDSIKRLNLYIDMIQVRRYTKRFSDENIDIDVTADVTGKMNSLEVDYRTREVIKTDSRQPIIVRAGAETKFGDKFELIPKVSVQDRKGNIYSVGGNKEQFVIGVTTPLFKIK